MNALNVKNIAKSYGGFKLNYVNFCVGEGRVAGLIGANGAGKTTLIKSILNIIPHGGDAEIFGISVKENEAEAKNLCGYAGGGFKFYGEFRLKKIASAVRGFYGKWNPDKFTECMNKFRLDENKRVKELSEGMKIKFSAALALSHGAKLLILDEPTSGLDPLSREEFCDTVTELTRREGVAVLFSTHITSDLSRIADDVIMLSGGEVILCAPLIELTKKYKLAEFKVKPSRKVLGLKEVRGGYAGLIESGDEAAGATLREPTLDEITVHLETERRAK